MEFVCYVFTFSVTQLHFVTDYLSKYFGRSIYLVDGKLLNELDGYKLECACHGITGGRRS